MDEIEKAEQRYINIIRKFTTCELLEYFSKKSIEAYQNGKKVLQFVMYLIIIKTD